MHFQAIGFRTNAYLIFLNIHFSLRYHPYSIFSILIREKQTHSDQEICYISRNKKLELTCYRNFLPKNYQCQSIDFSYDFEEFSKNIHFM